MNILLTGATGFLGHRTLEELVKLETVTKVISTGRTLREDKRVDHPKAEYILGNLNEPSFIRQLFESGIDVVIHAAALSSPWGTYQEFYTANVETVKNLLRSSEEAGVKRFIFISSPSIYNAGKSRLNVKEDSELPKKFINNYAYTKYLAEEELRKSSIPYVTLRPRAIVGKGDTVIMPRMIKAYEEGKLRIIGDGQNVVDLTPVSSVVSAILLSLNGGNEILNQAYNISNGEEVKLWEVINQTLVKLGKAPITKHVPFRVVDLYAQVLEIVSRLTNGKEPALTKYGISTLAHSFTLDNSKAKEMLGFKPAMTLNESIDEFVEWYKGNSR